QLFAGSRDGVTPFSNSGGRVEYAGDDGQNLVDVAAGLAVANTDAGSDVFMRARTGDGEVFGSAAANTGSGVLQSTAITDHAAWNRATLRVEFTTGDSYRVLDAGGTELATGTWQSGESIDAGGARITLTGAPAAGDAFTVERAPTRDVFASVKALADALEAPAATAAERARRDNVISGSIADLGTAQDHMLSLRASTGARLASLDSASDTRGAEEVSLSATLSQLRDVDYAKAATQLALHATALEAAQRTIVRVQSLSLFDRLG
ncbi:MAG: flagellar hook-associated protein FlgL, partial [Proteobacteria bacterium]|nr:flagellar hook-associated protein FlgL [Pseudomonadota bacterium]